MQKRQRTLIYINAIFVIVVYYCSDFEPSALFITESRCPINSLLISFGAGKRMDWALSKSMLACLVSLAQLALFFAMSYGFALIRLGYSCLLLVAIVIVFGSMVL